MKMECSVTEDAVVNLISRHPSCRTKSDIESVAYWLRRRSNLLDKLSKDVLHDIIRNCGYKKARKDEIIIRQGDVGESLYILISGKVSVYVDSDDGILLEQQSLDLDGIMRTSRGQPQGSPTNHYNTETIHRSQLGKHMTSFENGSSFGEIALLTKENIRNATIIADEVCHLLQISTDLFSRSLKSHQETELRERYDFIKHHPWFSKWNPRLQRMLEMCLQKVCFGYGEKIVCQGQPVEGIYFILRGQVGVTVEPQRHRLQYPVLVNEVKSQRGRRFEMKTNDQEKKMRRHIDVCVIGPGQIIGDMELICDLPTSIASITATSKTETFFLDSKNFDRIIVKKNQKTMDEMKTLVSQKLSARGKVHGENVPLFLSLYEKIKRRRINNVHSNRNSVKEAGTNIRHNQMKDKDLKHLVTLFLNDQSTLSSPYTVDSIFYRYRSFMNNKQILRNTNRKLKRFDDLWCPKGRVPRSLSQIKNNVFAQQKLLGRPVTAQGTDMDPEINRSAISRSRTLLRSKSDLGERRQSSPISSNRMSQSHRTIFSPFSCQSYGKLQNISTKLIGLQESKMEVRSKEIGNVLAKENFERTLQQIRETGEGAEDLKDVCEFDDLPMAWDGEVTDSRLTCLEKKLTEFCNAITKVDYRPKSIQIRDLKRFKIQNSSDIPQTGGTVLVEYRPCLQISDDVLLTKHSHIHHYILNK